MIKMLCERCGRVYGAFWGSVGEGSGVFVGVCFDCDFDSEEEG